LWVDRRQEVGGRLPITTSDLLAYGVTVRPGTSTSTGTWVYDVRRRKKNA
jgi:hypothetical protein